MSDIEKQKALAAMYGLFIYNTFVTVGQWTKTVSWSRDTDFSKGLLFDVLPSKDMKFLSASNVEITHFLGLYPEE